MSDPLSPETLAEIEAVPREVADAMVLGTRANISYADAEELWSAMMDAWGRPLLAEVRRQAAEIERLRAERAPAKPFKPWLRPDERGEFDEFFADSVTFVHAEMMDKDCLWIGFDGPGTERWSMWIRAEKGRWLSVNAFEDGGP